MENVLSVIWIIFMVRNHPGGEEALKMYLMRFVVFMKISRRGISILPMRTFLVRAKKEKNVRVNWQISLWIKA